jgi:signal transduction histidine kinase
MAAYSRLARLPQPTLAPLDLAALVRRVAKLELRIPIELVEGPRLTISGDRDQLEQLLINLVRNATDAAMETGGRVRIQWSRLGGQMELSVLDEGPGISNPANLFVPFFTTKPGGSGIGLVLSRQIAEAHGGSLTLENRTDRQGSVAQLSLPI